MKKSIWSRAACLVVAAAAGAFPADKSAEAACGFDSYIGSVCTVGYSFCPRGTLDADGTILAISSNTTLFSLYGTIYGGDGRTSFALPNLQGRAVVGQGQGPGLASLREGQVGGNESVTLSLANLPSHSHSAAASYTLHASAGSRGRGNTSSPAGAVLAPLPRTTVYSTNVADIAMGPTSTDVTVTIDPAGAATPAPLAVRDPYLILRQCVVLQGFFPSRP